MRFLYLLLLVVFTSCHYLGPVDEEVMREVVVEPSQSELTGTWELDSFSYNLIKEQYDLSGFCN